MATKTTTHDHHNADAPSAAEFDYDNAITDAKAILDELRRRRAEVTDETNWGAAGDAQRASSDLRHIGDWLLGRGEYAS